MASDDDGLDFEAFASMLRDVSTDGHVEAQEEPSVIVMVSADETAILLDGRNAVDEDGAPLVLKEVIAAVCGCDEED